MEELHPLVEWAVWGHLDSQSNLELILLKGHLFLEVVLNSALSVNGIKENKNYSFHRKIAAFGKIKFKEKEKQKLIIEILSNLNKLRNKFAHEWQFDINSGEFEKWSLFVLENLEGTKFSNYTYRTKIVHAFSVVTKNILMLNEKTK